jgi:UDP-N-acetylmuramate dehydrogenase
MKLWNGLQYVVECDRDLKDLTTFGTGGLAEYFCRPSDAAGLGTILKRCGENSIRVRYIGRGSNIVVVSERVEGMVVQVRSPAFAEMTFGPEGVVAGAGAASGRLLAACADRGLSGLEFMAGVPGTVGGATASGASTRGGRFLDRVAEVQLMDPNSGDTCWRKPSEQIPGHAVLACRLGLEPDDPASISSRIRDEMEYRKKTQPHGAASAGCAFRNPPGDYAGRLIDKAGLKGAAVGGVQVSEVHANFIVNRGNGSGEDFKGLVELIRQRVRDNFGANLELGVELW